MEKRSRMVWCHEMGKCMGEKQRAKKRCKKEIDFTERETSQGESATQTQQRKRACDKDLEGKR